MKHAIFAIILAVSGCASSTANLPNTDKSAQMRRSAANRTAFAAPLIIAGSVAGAAAADQAIDREWRGVGTWTAVAVLGLAIGIPLYLDGQRLYEQANERKEKK